MKITVCDICKDKEDIEKRWYYMDRRADAAGGMEDEGEGFDLCTACELKVLRKLTSDTLTTGGTATVNNKKIIAAIKLASKEYELK